MDESPKVMFMENEYGRWKRVNDEFEDIELPQETEIRELRSKLESLTRENEALKAHLRVYTDWEKFYERLITGSRTGFETGPR